MAPQEWSRRSELGGKTMSSATRERLQEMWQSLDVAMHRRKAALRLWSAVPDRADLKHLSSITAPDGLTTEALRARLILGDTEAIPALIEKLRQEKDKFY